MITGADRELLARLFADERADFRHQIGLSRASAGSFYVPGVDAASIRADKQTVLDSPSADQYLTETDEGRAAFREFVRTVFDENATPNLEADPKLFNRAVILALEPDWMLMAPGPWRLVWASVCFPTRWSLAGKALQPLADIHAVVPGLNSTLGGKIERFFDHLVPGEGWKRANWGLSSNAHRNQHPELPYTPLTNQTPLTEAFLRIESQHLLKMPATGAIAFGIRIVHFPLAEVAAHPSIAAGLRARLRTMPTEVAAYKGIPDDFWQRF